jgi:cell division protein FtsB
MTGRVAILAVVLLALALSYVIPLRIYLAQQAEIAELRGAQAEQRRHLADLEAEAARWEDDAYIRIQARKRLYFVEPGQVPLITFWQDEAAGDAGADPPPPAPERAWWERLWSSVQEADRGVEAPPPSTGAG